MKSTVSDLLKHSGVYAVGMMLTRITSLVLLPVYTHYLSPADYGIVAVIDIAMAMVAIVVRGGMVQAVNRFHFHAQNEPARDAVWWSGLSFVAVAAAVLALPALLLRDSLGRLLLGAEVHDSAILVTIALAHLWIGSVSAPLETYVQVRKWSRAYVALSLGRLLLNAAMNVALLATGFGVFGVLMGNLVAGGLFATTLFVLFQRDRGRFFVSGDVARQLLRYGGPLVVTGLMAAMMHQADRFFLRAYSGLDEVGIYSLAYQFGFGINALILVPFSSIWSVTQFEVAEDENADLIYCQTFRWLTRVLLVAMLALSLFARPLVALLAAPAYAPAADLIPIICLGYFLFSLSSFINMPATLSRRTTALLPGSILAAGTNLLGNYMLVPRYGAIGAAWVTVGTFLVLCVVNYLVCVSIRRIPFGYGAALGSLTLSITVYISCRWFVTIDSVAIRNTICLMSWLACAGFLLRTPGLLLLDRAKAWVATMGEVSAH